MRDFAKTRGLAMIAGLAALFAVGWVLGFGAQRGFWSQETAAWVQAIGSVAALGIAIWIPQLERARRRAQLAGGLVSTCQVGVEGIIVLDMFLRDERSRSIVADTGLPTHALTNADQALSSFPIWELGDAEAIERLNGIRGALSTTQMIAKRALLARPGSANLEKDLAALWHVVDQSKEDLQNLGNFYKIKTSVPKLDIDTFREGALAEAEARGWPGSGAASPKKQD